MAEGGPNGDAFVVVHAVAFTDLQTMNQQACQSWLNDFASAFQFKIFPLFMVSYAHFGADQISVFATGWRFRTLRSTPLAFAETLFEKRWR